MRMLKLNQSTRSLQPEQWLQIDTREREDWKRTGRLKFSDTITGVLVLNSLAAVPNGWKISLNATLKTRRYCRNQMLSYTKQKSSQLHAKSDLNYHQITPPTPTSRHKRTATTHAQHRMVYKPSCTKRRGSTTDLIHFRFATSFRFFLKRGRRNGWTFSKTPRPD